MDSFFLLELKVFPVNIHMVFLLHILCEKCICRIGKLVTYLASEASAHVLGCLWYNNIASSLACATSY